MVQEVFGLDRQILRGPIASVWEPRNKIRRGFFQAASVKRCATNAIFVGNADLAKDRRCPDWWDRGSRNQQQAHGK